jgi:DNA-binding transcriptional MerR regulator
MTDTEEQRLSFKDMCARFDVTPRTLRYYEYIELLRPERQGRARYYGPRDLARMTLILRGRRWGFSLEEVRQWLLIYEQQGTKAQLQTFIEMADRQLDLLEQQRRQTETAIEELKAQRDKVQASLR